MSILAYSGGKSSKGKKLYYSQFVVVDKSTGDTTRILAAMVSVDSVPGSASEIYIPADEFDGKKGVVDAIFEAPGGNNRWHVSQCKIQDGEGHPALPRPALVAAYFGDFQ